MGVIPAAGTALRAPAATSRRWRLLSDLGPPALAWLMAWTVFVVRSGQGLGGAFHWRTWARWDSAWYLFIAGHGYDAKWHCGGHSIPPHLPPGNYLCGTVQWFAGYPALMRVVADVTTLSVGASALLVSWALWYAFLAFGWRLLADAVSSPARWLCLGLLALAPGAVYFPALFPTSMLLAGSTACVYFALRSPARWAPFGAFAGGLVAGSAYITSLALLAGLVVAALVAGRQRWQAAVAGAAGVAVGVGAIFLAAQAYTGIWDGYFIAQRKYASGDHNPFPNLITHLRPIWKAPAAHAPLQHAVAEQSAYTAGLLLLALATAGAFFARHQARVIAEPVHPGTSARSRSVAAPAAVDIAVTVAAIVAWVIAYSAGQRISTWRSESLCVLAVVALRRLRWPVLVLPLVAAFWIASTVAIYFFNAQLI